MSTSSASSSMRTKERGDVNRFAAAFWLAKKEIKRAWLSYPASGLFVLFFGFLAIPGVSGVFTIDGQSNAGQAIFFADYIFVIAGCILVVNAISLDYLRIFSDDVFSHRTAFLRSLPLSTGTLVASRVMSMLFAIPFTVPAFFVVIFLFTDLRDLGFSYVWFCGIWLGWGLFYAGVTLLCELGLRGKVYCWLSLVLIALLAAIVLLIEGVFGAGLVPGSAELAVRHGPLAAIASLAVGGTGFVLLAKVTRTRLQRRDLPV